MELRQVEYVVAVAEEGTFTRAAASIPVSQPALSQGIQSLERELGVDLFARVGRSVRLTSAGTAFLEPARQLLRDARSAREVVAAVAGLEAGELDVVCLPTLAVEPMVDLVGRFRLAHPRVSVHIREPEDSGSVSSLVGSGDAELGLVELPARVPGLEAVPLLDQEVLVVCPPDTLLPGRGRRRVGVELVGALPLVATPSGTSTRRLAEDALGAIGLAPTIAVETQHREAITPLVLAGAGIALLPEPLARRAADQGAVVAKLEPALRREVGLVHRAGAPLSPAAKAFRQLALDLRSEAPDSP
jgi:DNA-binding transcriptional LysR family regulator